MTKIDWTTIAALGQAFGPWLVVVFLCGILAHHLISKGFKLNLEVGETAKPTGQSTPKGRRR